MHIRIHWLTATHRCNDRAGTATLIARAFSMLETRALVIGLEERRLVPGSAQVFSRLRSQVLSEMLPGESLEGT